MGTITPGRYKLTWVDENGVEQVRNALVMDQDGTMRAAFCDAAWIVHDSQWMDAEQLGSKLTRSTQAEKTDIDNYVDFEHQKVLEQLTQVALVTEQITKQRSWEVVAKLRRVNHLIEQLYEEMPAASV